MAIVGDHLYVAGFSGMQGLGATRIAKWDGLRWSALGSGVNGPVSALAASGGGGSRSARILKFSNDLDKPKRSIGQIREKAGVQVQNRYSDMRTVEGISCATYPTAGSARVLGYDPPDRVLLSWDISPRWQIEDDPLKTSEWEVRFVAETPQRTRVEIEHRNLDRHVEGWQGVREGVAGDQGWPLYLQRYADLFVKER